MTPENARRPTFSHSLGRKHPFANSVSWPSRVMQFSPLLGDRSRGSCGRLRSCPAKDGSRQDGWTQPSKLCDCNQPSSDLISFVWLSSGRCW